MRQLPFWQSFHIGLDMRLKQIIDVPETALDVTTSPNLHGLKFFWYHRRSVGRTCVLAYGPFC